MGIRFTTNTWRAPLLLIDSWLPAAAHQPSRPVTARAPLPQVVQRFTRAGWLGRAVVASPAVAAVSSRPLGSAGSGRACHVRVLRTAEDAPSCSRQETQLVISGRISDVCAELDRLAALEHQIGTVST